VSRKIEAGGEIFVSYGTEYWESAASTTHATFNVPEWEWDLSDPFARASALLVSVPCSSGSLVAPVPLLCWSSLLLLDCDAELWLPSGCALVGVC
jgi:hypothetical protein